MNKIYLVLSCLGFFVFTYGQYAPAAGQPGTTAIPYDSSCFVGWATHVEITRGYVNIADTTIEYQGSSKASFGISSNATGPATSVSTDAVSLGDSGIAIVTFSAPISNGQGYDFAIFENGVTDNFLELGLVEVSSDGIHYVRFQAHSATQTSTQIGGFGSVDPTKLYNLAGKYRAGFGTPFDLEELKDSIGIDINAITHVKIIDAIGSIGKHATYDANGNKINGLFPTPFNTGGFDLNAVGVINEANNSGIQLHSKHHFKIYPNPSKGKIFIEFFLSKERTIVLVNAVGEIVQQWKSRKAKKLSVHLEPGLYFLYVEGNENSKREVQKVVIR